jgi:hypothetical protein
MQSWRAGWNLPRELPEQLAKKLLYHGSFVTDYLYESMQQVIDAHRQQTGPKVSE